MYSVNSIAISLNRGYPIVFFLYCGRNHSFEFLVTARALSDSAVTVLQSKGNEMEENIIMLFGGDSLKENSLFL